MTSLLMREGRPAPVADWVSIAELDRDPFPIYERLRAEGGVHWVPSVGRYLITSYDAVSATEHDQDIFSANEEGSLQIRAMGHSMLRRDDPEHYVERRQWQPALKPNVIKRVWTEVFQTTAEAQLAQLIEKGPGADLVWDFAAPYAAECLRLLLGFYNVTQQDFQRWSQTLIDATGNYADDPDVWARGKQSFDEVDVALDDMLEWHMTHRDNSLLSSLLSMPGEQMPLQKIRANIKMSIGGGLNEPRDALGVACWAMLTHPEQRAAVMADASLWSTVFDETIRWIAPIGLYSRQTTRATVLAGVALPAGARLGICILSANRDDTIWTRPDAFDIHREVKPHLAFSKGTHVCLGAHAARSEVADIALPLLFERLKGLDIHPEHTPRIGGWVFRGMLSLPVTWQRASHTAAPSSVPSAETDVTPQVAIVGAGPAGCFTARELLRRLPQARIDIYDRMPVPYGLLRYGVAGDHQGTKAVARQFEQLLATPNVRFVGNTELGRDVMLTDIRSHYDAVVLASGMASDRRLDIPGASLPGVYGAGRITRRLNGHPEEAEALVTGRCVAIVGQGNVAIDVLRLLACDADRLEGSDIDAAVHAQLAGDIDTLHVLGRASADKARFDPVMVRELSQLPGVVHRLHGVDLDRIEAGKDARLDALRGLPREAARVRVTVEWWFGVTPERFSGTEHVEDVIITMNGHETRLPVDAVVTAIGFTDNPEGVIATALRALPSPSEEGRVEAGLYLAGWLRRGARGTIPDQRVDARALATAIGSDLMAGRISCDRSGLPVPEHAVDDEGWRRIDRYETRSPAQGRVRTKLITREALLSTAQDSSLSVPAHHTAGGRDASAPRLPPITVLFGTESGNAELVAEELQQYLEAGDDVAVCDLAEIMPDELDAERMYLVICSTYGDGDVPTSAENFYRALKDDVPDLSGVRFAVFGLGDSGYVKTYSRGSELLTEALVQCSAIRIGEFGRHDAGGGVPAPEAACDWVDGVLAVLEPGEAHAHL